RGLAIGMLSLAFVWTTDPTDLVVSLIAHARLPFRIGYPLLAGYRFLPFFADERAQVRLARRVRGVAPRGPLGGVRDAGGELITLLAEATRRATRIAVAMDARAFAAATRGSRPTRALRTRRTSSSRSRPPGRRGPTRSSSSRRSADVASITRSRTCCSSRRDRA